MKFSHIFIRRPIFAAVIAIFIVIVGGLAYLRLPVAQFPEVAPPTVTVTASYPGANAQIAADTVATPIEQEINGVENMIYMSSQSTSDGNVSITVTFELGTNLDLAQVLVQNRVAIAEPRLPAEVRQTGVVVKKNTPDILMVVHMLSPDNSYDQLYISNYALLQVRDVVARVKGVGSVLLYGVREYSMRAWLDPDKIASLGMTASEIVGALQQQNIQVAGGALGQPPMPNDQAFQTSLQLKGRLVNRRSSGISLSRPARAAGSRACAMWLASSLAASTIRRTASSMANLPWCFWFRRRRERMRWRWPTPSRRPWPICPRASRKGSSTASSIIRRSSSSGLSTN